MSIVEKYLKELKRAYYKNGGKEMWDNFEKIKEGASEEDIKKLKEEYPEVPDSLIELLKNVDGTYFRKYKGKTLFIDFSPSEKGVKGQIVRFLHDPDEIGVIADSFDEYLEKLIEYDLDFIFEDIME